jgi:hypothetical protein
VTGGIGQNSQFVKSLHEAHVPSADGPDVQYSMLPDPSITHGHQMLYFRDPDVYLKREILKADLVLGNVAWLTHPVLLDALRFPAYGCAMVVQKEDFLRMDTTATPRREWEKELRQRYEALRCSVERHALPGLASRLSYCSDPTVDAVRCVGNHNSVNSPAAPRMHNKFAVFCRVEECWNEEFRGHSLSIKPYAFWTGSFNWTLNAGRSFENAVLIYDEVIAAAAAEEWGNIFSLSEPLDWSSPYVTPQYRIGS